MKLNQTQEEFRLLNEELLGISRGSRTLRIFKRRNHIE